MRTSEEYRELVRAKDWDVHDAEDALRDAADLIDAVAWWAEKADLSHKTAADLLAAYRVSLRPAKPASGCEGCKHAEAANVSMTAWKRTCEECSRRQLYDRWEAKP